MSRAPLGLAQYIAALQCERRLWHGARAPATELAQWLEERSSIPGALRALRPQAVEIAAALPFGEALRQTRAWLASDAPGVLGGAALERGPWAGRVDWLERAQRGALTLCTWVADTSLREVDLDRAAYLAHLLGASAVALPAVAIWTLERQYAADSAIPNWSALLRCRDVSGDVRLLCSDLPAQLERAAQALRGAEAPAVEPSPHCWRPQRCELWSDCTRALPADALVALPRIRPAQFHALRGCGIEHIADIPDRVPLDPGQALTRAAWRAGRVVLAPGLGARLRALGPDMAYLDFESALPAVPCLARSTPLEPIPLQWSLRCCPGVGAPRSADFLAPPGVDSRPAFARSLVSALSTWPGPIAVYSDFEAQVIERLEALLPAQAAALRQIRQRLVDFLPLLREGVAHPDFRGSYSLKRVAPVLCEEIRYDALPGIASGAEAARVLEQWLTGEIAERAERVAAELQAYCRLDVAALCAVHRKLIELSAGSAAQPPPVATPPAASTQ